MYLCRIQTILSKSSKCGRISQTLQMDTWKPSSTKKRIMWRNHEKYWEVRTYSRKFPHTLTKVLISQILEHPCHIPALNLPSEKPWQDPVRGMGMQVSPAPEPRDIVWHNVARPQASGDGSFIRLIFAKCVHAMHDWITTEPTTVALSGWKRAISLYHPETARHNCWCVNSLWRLLSSLVPCQLWEFVREDSGRQS